jgi:hypothetical protein
MSSEHLSRFFSLNDGLIRCSLASIEVRFVSKRNRPCRNHFIQVKRHHRSPLSALLPPCLFLALLFAVKKNMMKCEKPLLLPPPENLTGSSYDYSISPPRADLKDKGTYKEVHQRLEKGALQGKREYFMLCGLVRALNQALIHHKEVACGVGVGDVDHGPANLNQTYTVYDDPSNY